MQWLTAFVLTISRNSGNFIYYGFAYLVLEQFYQCRYGPHDEFMSCSAEEEICPALEENVPGFQYQVDTTYEYYINNWYVQMDLVCANKAKTNSMLIPYYVASGMAGFLFFSMPDKLGRKLTMNINLGVQVFA